jgi:hypothetical protein
VVVLQANKHLVGRATKNFLRLGTETLGDER